MEGGREREREREREGRSEREEGGLAGGKSVSRKERKR